MQENACFKVLIPNLKKVRTVGAKEWYAGWNVGTDVPGKAAQGRASISFISSSLIDLKRPASASITGLAM